MLSVLDPVGHGGFDAFGGAGASVFHDDASLGGRSSTKSATRTRRGDGRRGRQHSGPSPSSTLIDQQLLEQQQQQKSGCRKSAKVSSPPSGAAGRSLDDVAEFSVSGAHWRAEMELAAQRAGVLRTNRQQVEAEVAELQRNREAHRRLHDELLAIFDAIFAEADAVFERHRLRLAEEAASLSRRSAELEDRLERLAAAADSSECHDASGSFVASYEHLMDLLPAATPRQRVPCHGAFGEAFQQAVKARLAERSSDALLADFRERRQSGACRVFPCLLNLLAEVRSELLAEGAGFQPLPTPPPHQQQPVGSVGGGGSVRRLEAGGGARLTDLALVRPAQTLFYKPKFGVKRQRGWFGWTALPDTVLYGVCPGGDGGSQLLVMSRSGQYLTGMRLNFDACPAASGCPASRFEALHFGARAQLLFLSDAPNNRVLLADLCGVCRLQVSGLNQPRGAHHDDLNERLFVINGGTGTLEVFACPLYPQQQQQQQQQHQPERIGRCVPRPDLLSITAVATSLQCLYVTDCQLARLFVFANQTGFKPLRTVDLLLPSPTTDARLTPQFVYFRWASPPDGSEPEVRTVVLASADKQLGNRALYCANEAGCTFHPDELTVYICHPTEACIIAVKFSP